MLDQILEFYPGEEFLLLSPEYFNDAIIGVTGDLRIIYHTPTIISLLMEHEEMEEIDAIEHYEYNILGSYVGEQTPIFSEV